MGEGYFSVYYFFIQLRNQQIQPLSLWYLLNFFNFVQTDRILYRNNCLKFVKTLLILNCHRQKIIEILIHTANHHAILNYFWKLF